MPPVIMKLPNYILSASNRHHNPVLVEQQLPTWRTDYNPVTIIGACLLLPARQGRIGHLAIMNLGQEIQIDLSGNGWTCKLCMVHCSWVGSCCADLQILQVVGSTRQPIRHQVFTTLGV